MSKQTADIPEGYRVTELGPLPEDWQVSTIGALFDIHQGKALSPKSRTGKCPHPFLRTANVLWGRVNLSVLDQMDFSDQEVERLSLTPGDLLVCEGGDIGRTAMWRGEAQRCCYQNHVHRLRARSSGVIPAFYMYWMQAAILLLGRYRGAGNKTTIPNLSQSRLSRFEVPFPPLSEQKKIAAVLSTVQQAKEKTEAVIAALRELKKSLMKHLFTYGPVAVDEAENVRLKETEVGMVPEGWEQGTLGRVALLVMGSSPRGETYNSDGKGLPLVNGPAEYGRRHPVPVKWTTDPTRVCKAGDTIVCVRGNTTGRMNEADRELCIGRGVAAISPVEAKSDRQFLWFLLEREAPKILERATGGGSTFPNINKPELMDWSIPVPPLPEQRRIGAQMATLDAKIEAEQNRKTSLDQLFQTLLNDLMTARVRVNDLEVGA